MKSFNEIFDLINNHFSQEAKIAFDSAQAPDLHLEYAVSANKQEYLLVNPFQIDLVADFLKNNDQLSFDSLLLLSGVDDADGEKSLNPDGSFNYIGGFLSIYYHLESTKYKHRLCLKVRVDREKPEVNSVAEIWKAADWHEREAFDMFGIRFVNHPNLIRILMPYDWDENSFPLRKDFKNPEFYNGMKVVY